MIEILPMTRAHEDAVLAMMRVFYSSPAVHTNGSEEIYKNDFLACVGDSPYAEGYLFGEAGKPVGYAMLAKSFSTEFGRPCVWIEDLYLLPEARGRGTAGRFFRFLEEKYPDAIFRLEVEEENENAVRAYLKSGFSAMPYLEMKK